MLLIENTKSGSPNLLIPTQKMKPLQKAKPLVAT